MNNTVDIDRFVNYCMDFYGAGDSVYKYGFTREEIELATRLYCIGLAREGEKFCGDTLDRERVRDIIIDAGYYPELV